jgi:phage gp36-like protein
MSTYAAQSDIEDIFSPDNVAAWSLFETGAPTGAADATRVANALAQADSQINAFFTGGPYQVPLVCVICKPVVSYWAAVIAGVWLYGSRMTTSYIDYTGNRYIALQQAVFADMDLYKSGVKRLDAPQRYPQPTAPAAER